jgi:hypothetical protein
VDSTYLDAGGLFHFAAKTLCKLHFGIFAVGKVVVDDDDVGWWRLVWRRLRAMRGQDRGVGTGLRARPVLWIGILGVRLAGKVI